MEDSRNINEILYKIVIVGEAGVGKSCILNKFVHDKFEDNYAVTIGVEFSSKIIEIDSNIKMTLQLWDTAGQESFRSIVKSFYRNAAGAFLVYDICKAETFHNLNFWIKEIKEKSKQNMVLILVGNKNDKENERQVSKEEGVNYMKENGITLFFETSAKTGENIDLAFCQIGKLIFINHMSVQFSIKDSLIEKDRLFSDDTTRVDNKGKIISNKSNCC